MSTAIRWGALLTPLLLTLGCQSAQPLRDPVRAIWVTRGDYKTAEDVSRVIQNCEQAGFNTILFQVRGNGTAFYDSPYEPWAEQFDFKDPGYDPLALAVEEAHRRGVDLHAWVNVMPAWRGEDPPSDPDQLYNAMPDWFWYDQNGNRQKLSSFYVSLNPCRPEVREYLVEVFSDIAKRYDVDGLHLDYIRFPNEPPATPRKSGLDYPRDARTLALFKADTGQTPDSDPEAWTTWRREQVTQLVREIRQGLNQTRSSVALTAAASSVADRARTRYFQDAQGWLRENLVDAIMMMNYTDDPEQFAKRNEPWLAVETEGQIVPGLWFGRHKGKTDAEATEAVRAQIERAVAQSGNVCVFAYSSLFERRAQDDIAPDSAEPSQRQVRREMLLPITRWF
jgi:uncharacterized lipoprotein YddW (UPF0748 family)